MLSFDVLCCGLESELAKGSNAGEATCEDAAACGIIGGTAADGVDARGSKFTACTLAAEELDATELVAVAGDPVTKENADT